MSCAPSSPESVLPHSEDCSAVAVRDGGKIVELLPASREDPGHQAAAVRQTDAALAKAKAELDLILHSSEKQIEHLSGGFRSLAVEASKNLNLAAGVIRCVESERMASLLTQVQGLSASAQRFLTMRLEAVERILETLKAVARSLEQLGWITRRLETITPQFKALSVFTNVEVSRLGSVSTDFLHLAQELTEFAKKVIEETHALSSETAERKHAIEDTGQALSTDLPSLRNRAEAIERDIGQSLVKAESRFGEVTAIPQRFQDCVQQTAQNIDRVVAAIQGHDITRQQIEHVRDGFDRVSLKLADSLAESHFQARSQACAGLIIQIAQLRNIKEVVAGWISQVAACVTDIQRLSASEIAGIGPVVLEQEHDLSSYLRRIEDLQSASQAYSERIRATLSGLNILIKLVNEHLRRADRIRNSLQMITMNSLIEAQRLGVRGAVVSAIANLINRCSEEWNAICEESQRVLTEVLGLVQQTERFMEAFSEANCETLLTDQRQTAAILGDLRTTANEVAQEAEHMQATTRSMQATVAEVSESRELLEGCFGKLDSVLESMEAVAGVMGCGDEPITGRLDAAELEHIYSASYSTEMERHVLRAILYGTAMPETQVNAGGNGVELF